MAVVTAALVGVLGAPALSPEHWRASRNLGAAWLLGHSLIFLLVGLAVPAWRFHREQGLWLAVLVATALGGRVLIIFGLLPLLGKLRLAQQVSTAFKSVMFWGGLRGAVSLALALIVLEDSRFPPEVQQFIGVLVTGFVLFTLFVNAPTVGLLIRFFRLDALSPEDRALRDRALAGALEEISQSVEAIASRQAAAPEIVATVSGAYHQRSEAAGQRLGAGEALSEEAWVRLGLANPRRGSSGPIPNSLRRASWPRRSTGR